MQRYFIREPDQIRLKHIQDASIEIVSFIDHITQTEFEEDRNAQFVSEVR